MIVQDIVWADFISWLHKRGIRIERYGDEAYSVFFPHWADIRGFNTLWDDRGSSVTCATIDEAFTVACKLGNMSVDVGEK